MVRENELIHLVLETCAKFLLSLETFFCLHFQRRFRDFVTQFRNFDHSKGFLVSTRTSIRTITESLESIELKRLTASFV